ncbi:hypothetical protein KAZ82_00530 [Candidatus Babeliales bacterium]|nr:hypothetical protein [Candidatus Babeliales bacterium]
MVIKNVIMLCFLMSAEICTASEPAIKRISKQLGLVSEICGSYEEVVKNVIECEPLSVLTPRVSVISSNLLVYMQTVVPVLKEALHDPAKLEEAVTLLDNPETMSTKRLIRDLNQIVTEARGIMALDLQIQEHDAMKKTSGTVAEKDLAI